MNKYFLSLMSILILFQSFKVSDEIFNNKKDQKKGYIILEQGDDDDEVTVADDKSDVKEEKIAGLVNKSEKSGVPYGILKKSYDRGMAAWRTGHRPGASQQQWAFARVNSMLTGGKADPDLQAKIRSGGYKKKKKEKKGD